MRATCSVAVVCALFGAVVTPHKATFLTIPHLTTTILTLRWPFGEVTKRVALVAFPTSSRSDYAREVLMYLMIVSSSAQAAQGAGAGRRS